MTMEWNKLIVSATFYTTHFRREATHNQINTPLKHNEFTEAEYLVMGT